jgi:flagellar hook-length control protein FliK
LEQIANLIAAGLPQDKKGLSKAGEKKDAELPGIQVKDQNTKEGNEPRIVVIDLRKQEQGAKARNLANNSKQVGAELKAGERIETEGESLNKEVRFYASGNRAAASTESGKSFGQTLNRYQGLSTTDLQRMSELLKNEIVKNTGIVLKTNNQGEIRLILKPETLGKVKINLNLNNNRIEGKILVENNIVREMVENSLQGLNHALMDEGFDAVSLHVSVNDGKQETKEENTAGSRKKGGSTEFEKNIPLLTDSDLDYGLVNLMI